MTAERFAEIERIFDQARGVALDERAGVLDELCAGDAELRAEVEKLLSHDIPTPRPMVDRLTEALAGDAAADAGRHRSRVPGSGDLTGKRVGPYFVERVLGRGGMGVVYLAYDEELDRDVAIKTLPAELAGHTTRADRFLREAQLLASLSHPNIATVYGLEDCGPGGRCLVLELVDGESLAHRLARGALPIPTALDVCRQIAAGVDAAHAAGVIHRDLKPANVMLATGDGGVKVLDFGLARSIDPPPGGGSRGSRSKPVNVDTQPGAAIGTPGYMSPEQLRGEAVDKRTDLFALGCILYECLTGHVAFAGASAAESSVNVLERDPDWSLLPPKTPATIRRLLQRCLAKDRAQRLRDAGDAQIELQDALAAREWTSASSSTSGTISPATGQPRRKALAWLSTVVASAAIATLVALVAVSVMRPRAGAGASNETTATASAPFQRFTLSFPNNAEQSDLAHLRLAITRDGGKLVVSANDGKHPSLFLRERDKGEFRRIEGTDKGWIPSFSPDGQWIAYFDAGVIRKRPVAGGNPSRISDVQGYWSQYSWSSDGYLSYIPYWGRGVARIHSEGGAAEFLTQPDYDRGEFAHVSPVSLADGSAVLYMVWDGGSGTRIDAVNVKTRKQHTVVADGAYPRVAQTPRGAYLLWVRSGTIYAAPFDTTSLQRTGPEFTVAESVLFDQVLFVAMYDVSDDGTLAYVPGPMFVEESRLAWFDPKSPATDAPTMPFNDERMGFCEPTFSADGSVLSFLVKGDVFKPALYDLKAGTTKRIVTDGDCESCAVSPDGKRLAYCSNKEGKYNVYVRDLATAVEHKVFKGPGDYPSSIAWSPDSSRLTFAVAPMDGTKRDIYVVDVSNTSESSPPHAEVFVGTKSEERGPRWSPDGKWLAYASDESGTRQVYVRSFPDGRLTRQVSPAGGDWPVWAADGSSTLYYVGPGRSIHATSLAPDGSVIGQPRIVYTRAFGQADFDACDYTTHPDGRLLLVEPSERGPKVSQINVLLNWYNLPQARDAK